MSKTGFSSGDILIPKDIDLNKWCIVACDQYTSDRNYWKEVEKIVQDNKSALNITFPEVFLEDDDKLLRIKNINQTMKHYIDESVFKEIKDKYIYVERTQNDGHIRFGIMGIVDLEEYDFSKGSQSLIRATEGTVLERIPPRVAIRENAAIEVPHIMLLIDDTEKKVIEPLFTKKDKFEIVYDSPLMKKGGSIKGFIVDEQSAKKINETLLEMSDKNNFSKKYNIYDKGVLLFAVGDGNHSLATAKTCYENLKKAYSEEEIKNSPARYALVEVVNLHSEALEFEPIHRVVFDVDTKDLIDSLEKFYDVSYEECEAQCFEMITKEKRCKVYIKNPTSNLVVGTLQKFLDEYLLKKGGKIDYIHGDNTASGLSSKHGNIGFLLPVMKKQQLFKTVILDGALPRKTFSMGHAWDKRYYLECRNIK